MRSAPVAVLWESWRLTRSRLFFIPPLATLCGWALSRGPVTSLVFVVLFAAGLLMAMSLPIFGVRGAFPLSTAFARPIRTSVLVAVPLSYVFVAAAACYLVPAVFLRVFMGAALPLLPPATLVGTLGVLVAGCSWFTRIPAARFGLAFAGFILAGALLRFLRPFSEASVFQGTLSPQLCVLSAMDYLIVAFFILAVYAFLVVGVLQQRQGEDEASSSGVTASASLENRADIFRWLRNTCVGLVSWRCPVSSATGAEIWFEMQCYGAPVLMIGVVLALCIPALAWLANENQSPILLVFTACTPIAPLAAGISASIWNRRNTARARVFVFEAARPVGTSKLIGLQVLVTSGCIFGAWILILTSAWLSLPLLKDFLAYGSPLAVAMDGIQKYGFRVVSFVVICFTLLTAVLALLAAVRAFASSYGRRFWLGVIIVVAELLGVMIAVARGYLGGAVIGVHIWVLAIAIPVGTLLVLGRVVALGLLTVRQVAALAFAWLVFAALYLDLLHAGGVLNALPALAGLALASTLVPLLATGLAPWSLNSLRHA